MAPLIPIAISLATKFAPMLLERLFGSKAGKIEQVAKVAARVVGLATQITGQSNPMKLEQAIEAHPEHIKAFSQGAADLEIALAEEDTERHKNYLALLKSDVKSESWAARNWRPFNGFMFGITLFLDRMIWPYLIPWLFKDIPALKDIVYQNIPFPVYIFWAGVLGINGLTRGQEKLQKVKQANGGQQIEGIANMIKALM